MNPRILFWVGYLIAVGALYAFACGASPWVLCFLALAVFLLWGFVIETALHGP